MKNLKIFGIVMMLVMGMSFTSCSSDDDEPGASAGSIKEYLEGEWFLVEEEAKYKYNGKTDIWITLWDYDDQTKNGIKTKNGVIVDGNRTDPEKLYISYVAESIYDIIDLFYYRGTWYSDNNTYELDGNIIYEENGESSGGYYSEKTYIKSISKETLVIVEETKEGYDDEMSHDIITKTYLRID